MITAVVHGHSLASLAQRKPRKPSETEQRQAIRTSVPYLRWSLRSSHECFLRI